MEMSDHLPQRGGHLLAPPAAGRREARDQGGDVDTPSPARRSPPGAFTADRKEARRQGGDADASYQRGGHPLAPLTVGCRDARGRGGDARAGNKGLTIIRKKSSEGGRRE